MLPLEFRLTLSEQGAQWEALNRTAATAFQHAQFSAGSTRGHSAGRACHGGGVPCEGVLDDDALRLHRQRRRR